MHFREEELEGFLNYFEQIKSQIENMPGLVNLKLYQDDENQNILFTMSTWLNQKHLDHYRNSELFAAVWPKTKALFADKAEAWSLKLK